MPASPNGEKRRKKRTPAKSTAASQPRSRRDGGLPSDHADFAHASERQFARLLDFYQIEWQYEPTSFDLAWDREGKTIQRFTPDFYLPAYDLYIEITTLNQRLVTKKNRKVRMLRERYPEVNCKIFYQRDYLSLVMKYGLDDERAAAG